jgi:predicted DNA-binding protein YlxM (UPF0122 family)
MKLTVKEYATKFNISVQAVYQRLNKNTLRYVVENGVKFVLVEDTDLKAIVNNVENEHKSLLKIIKKQQKEITRLNKKLEKSQKRESKVLKQFIVEMKYLQLKAPDDIIDIEPKNKKRRKKK